MGRFDDRVVGRSSGPVRHAATEANSYAVSAVHAGSIADAAGLKVGLLYLPSQPEALSPLVLPERAKSGEVVSRFIDPGANEEIEITTKGFPFGIELAKSPSALARDVVGGDFDVDLLAAFLHGGDRDAIGRFMSAVATAQRSRNRSLGEIVKGWLGRRVEDGDEAALDAGGYMGLLPHAKLAGAFWLAANKNAAGARLLLRAWEDWGTAGSGNAYLSLYHLTRALVGEAEVIAGSDVRAELIEARRNADESALVAAFAGDWMTEQPALRRSILGQRFPRDYRLAAYDPLKSRGAAGAPYIVLSDVRETLRADQRLLVIALGAYRANGFYSRILHRFQELHPVLGEAYPQVHVLTGFEPGNRHNAEWLAGEMLARQRGADITILHDPNVEMQRGLSIERTPHAFILDRDGVVRYDGFMPDEGGFWQGLVTA